MVNQTCKDDLSKRELLRRISDKGSQQAADGISWLLGEQIEVTNPAFQTQDFSSLMEEFGGPETEIVGIYIEARYEVPIHVMLILPFSEAIQITEQLLGQPPGSINEIDELGHSALAEMANVTGTRFFNAIAEITGKTIRPSTPAVMIDMLGSILTIILAKTGCISGDVLTFETAFVRQTRDMTINFRAISSPAALEMIMSDDG